MNYMTERERLEESLRGWASDVERLAEARDRLVTHAVAIGISKNRIHVLTGLARTTIDLILKEESTDE